ncbi:MAG: class II fructose-bisphosphate aldolase [Candidatus Hydrogenedentota bacterium]|nr:MAG: class II fructose-bisphosphate aldolase [Candidatus Hydrogenedentota bacterium]
MPIVNFEKYGEMLDRAKAGKFAYPAINVSSNETINAALQGFAEANSDGIIQVSTGAGEFASGSIKDMVLGAIALADFAQTMAARYDVNIALHTDHCVPEKADTFMRPLIEETARRRAAGQPNLFNSHMFDGSVLPLKENMEQSVELMKLCRDNDIILEVEAGVVGGEEDGIDNTDVPAEKLYTTPEDMLGVHEALSPVGGRYMFAATFGNVHGVYKPGNVKLTPSILKDGQDAVVAKYGAEAHFDLVFHGGSGSSQEEIHETLGYGVVKMNVDTDCQYHFTRPIADHMLTNYEGVLRVDGEMGNKKVYDPRSYLKKATASMAQRVVEACKDLKSDGKSMGR